MRDKFYHNPPEYKNVIKKISQLKEKYEFLNVYEIGKTVLGRSIFALGLGNAHHVNLYVGGVHASEWLTCTLLFRFLEDICDSVKTGREFRGVDFNNNYHKGILFIPALNPDGIEIVLNGYKSAETLSESVKAVAASSDLLWQANANGVDLNRNFDAGHNLCKDYMQKLGIHSASPRYYPGEFAHNQPETKALIDLCEEKSINCAYAFHSQGEEIFYEYEGFTPQISFHIASLLSSYCGYSLVKQSGISSHGGFKDWFLKRFGKPAFTIEIGRGNNPLPIEDFAGIYEKVVDALCISAII